MNARPMRIAWITDPHLNHCSLPAWDRLVAQVDASGCDAVVISGDISEGEDVVFQLRRMADAFAVPIHFVLGNHDFYHSSWQRTVQAVREATRRDPRLHYLSDRPPWTLPGGAALIGVDGWGDASEGDYAGSTVRLNDFRLIEDFQAADPAQWQAMLLAWGRRSAERLQTQLLAALASHDQLLVVTHVPPFRQACWYQGQTTDDNWAPFFVSGQCGQVLQAAAQQHPTARLQVLCGHTHHGGVAQMSENLTVTTAGAEYGEPAVAAVICCTASGLVIEPLAA